MKKNIIIGIVIVVIVGLLFVATLFIPEKKEKIKEELLGINYNIDGHTTELKYESSNPVAALYIKNYGSIVIELYPDMAPNTVNNFISLIDSGFYDNNTFHRLVPGFVLQGGDPTGSGTGGPGYNIKGEFTNNGHENTLKHEEGIVSMARSEGNDTGGSQFFIVLDDASHLDGNYAAFGKVIDGMQLIKKIEKKERVSDSNTGTLVKNLVLEKALVDLNGNELKAVIKEK